MPGVLLWGYDATNEVWIPLQVDANGYVKVDMSNIKLNDLADVSVAAPADGDFFYYDNATGLWKSKAHADLTTGVHSFDKSCGVTHSVAQSIPNNSWTTLTFNTENWDTDGIHDNVTNNSRLTCKTPGRYLTAMSVRFADNVNGVRLVYFAKNGTTIAGSAHAVDVDGKWSSLAAFFFNLAVDDYLEVKAYQTSGDALLLWGPAIFGMARIP